MTDTVAEHEHLEVDLTDTELYRHGFPHDVFTTLRREEPVRWQAFPDDFPGDHDEGFWVLSRHDDVQAASRDPELFSAYDGPTLSHQPLIRGTMLVSMDGRDHIRQRRLINAGFTPRMIRQLDEKTRGWAVSIIEKALELGTCNFVTDVAYQLPMHMIADIVGIPIEDRRVALHPHHRLPPGERPRVPRHPRGATRPPGPDVRVRAAARSGEAFEPER